MEWCLEWLSWSPVIEPVTTHVRTSLKVPFSVSTFQRVDQFSSLWNWF